MYRIDECSLAQNRVARRTQINGIDDMNLEDAVYLHPTVIHEDSVKNLGVGQERMSLNRGLIYPLRENPYFSALVFQAIAVDQD